MTAPELTRQDLMAINVPFGDLSEGVQWALKAAHADGEALLYHAGKGVWISKGPAHPLLDTTTYRLKPEPVVTTQEAKQYAHGYRNIGPMLTDTLANNEGIAGKTTTTLEDGKPVRIVWEADQ